MRTNAPNGGGPVLAVPPQPDIHDGAPLQAPTDGHDTSGSRSNSPKPGKSPLLKALAAPLRALKAKVAESAKASAAAASAFRREVFNTHLTHRLTVLGLHDELEDILEAKAFDIITAGNEPVVISHAIASGNDGSIHVAHGSGDKTFIAKRYKGSDTDKLAAEAGHEADMLRRFADPTATCAIDANGRVYVFMQQAAGDLAHLSKAFDKTGAVVLDETRRLLARRTLQEVSAQLRAMHASGYAHRDLKPGNIFFFADGTIRLGDFGRACRIDGDRKSTGSSGTPTYSPCEVLFGGESLDTKSDTWSLGMTVLALLVGERDLPTLGDSSSAVTAYKVEQLLDLRAGILKGGGIDFTALSQSKNQWAKFLQKACACDYDTTSYVLRYMVAPLEDRRDSDRIARNAVEHFAVFHGDGDDMREVCQEAAAEQTQQRALGEVVRLAHEMNIP